MQKKAGKKLLEHVEKGDLLQAVVIVDSYNDNFCPVASSPLCLMPLVNRPLLDYTLKCLSSARVQEAILFCTAHADKIKDFVRNGHWGRMVVRVIVSEGCRSLGDAMRDLDTKSIIRGAFILLSGNVVGNLKLLPALERHKKFATSDKGTAMTLIYKECGKKLKSVDDEIFVVADSHTNRILHYNKNPTSKKINIPLGLLLERSDVDIRCDILDTGVSICSVSVPPLFSDNFDFQTKDDFIRGLLMNDEIMEGSLYSYYLPNAEYASCVTNWQNYHSISHDVIHRWTFPQVPDNTDDLYSYRLPHIYIQEGVSLAKGCSILEDVVIAMGSKVGKDAKLTKSVVGKNCNISENSIVENSHLMSNVHIEADCKLEYTVLGEGCVIKSGAKISHSILGPGVIIESGKKIENTRLPQPKSKVDEDSSIGPEIITSRPKGEFDSESESEEGDVKMQWKGLYLDPPKDYPESDESSESGEELSDRGSVLQEDTNLFYNEVVDSLLRGYEDKISCDNLVLEINSSRYAYNVTVNEVNYYVTRAILSLNEAKEWKNLHANLIYFLPLLKNYMRNSEAMMDCLTAIEDEAEHKPNIKKFIVKILDTLYDKDVIGEDSILQWNRSPREDSPFSVHLREQISSFIEWLEEADEESSSDD